VGALVAAEPKRTRIQLCGRFVVELDGARLEDSVSGRQARLLFAFLTTNRNRSVERGRLVDVLWSGAPPAAAETTLRGLVFRLRQALGETRIEGRSELRLDLPEHAWIDVEAARGAIHEAESAIALQRWKQAWLPSRIAASIAETEFMTGHDGEWVSEQRGELDAVRLRALECVAETALHLGGTELAAAERAGRSLISAAPYRESGYAYLMQALERADNVAEALRVYENVRCLLRDELGIGPSGSLKRLHEALVGRQTPDAR
jgi:SARP family transcriptional regulator, regulator of embCAB operon